MSASALADNPASRRAEPSRAQVLAGRAITAVMALLLTMDVGIKLLGAKQAVDGTIALGYQAQHVTIIGLIGAACLILYLVPRTAPLGAVLWTGYFGGAIATQLRAGNPFLTHILPALGIAALLWLALWLRDERVRSLLGPSRSHPSREAALW